MALSLLPLAAIANRPREIVIPPPADRFGMDADAFHRRVEAEKRTELSRLGSNKLLVALTGADLTPSAVLRVAAHAESAAHETFREWAADEQNDRARAAFEAAAEREADHLDRVLDAFDDSGADFEPADGGSLHASLRGRTGTVERLAAGFVGRGLVADRTHAQLIGFFIHEADEARANLFRDLRTETTASLDDGLSLLADLCADDDWETAASAATYTIQVAYDDYADALAGMGVDPRPVC